MKYWFAGLTLLFLITSCSMQDEPIEERAKRAREGKGDIIIGAVAPWASYSNLWEGIEMAVEEVNRNGGVLGRRLKIIKEDDEGSVTKGQKIAQRFADNMDMVAVVGHYNSYISIPCSIIYEYNGLLMISPYSSDPKLTNQGFKRVFRNTINDEMFGKELAKLCQQQQYKNILIYHANNEYGIEFANAFERHCEELAINIKDRMSYDSFSRARDFQKDLDYWNDMYKFDAIFLAGTLPSAAVFVREAKSLGIDVPVVSGSGLDSKEFLEIAGVASEGTFIGVVFNPADPREKVRTFVEKFKGKYATLPDDESARGYDTIMVLAQAMETAESTVPDDVGKALRTMDKWDGILKKSSFDQKGDIMDAEITIKVVRNGRFEYFDNLVSGGKSD